MKFLEGVVYVYDFKTNRLVKDLDVVEPDSIIIFFKISDLFAALDRIQPEDLASIHLVRREVILEEGSQSKSLMYQEDFK